MRHTNRRRFTKLWMHTLEERCVPAGLPTQSNAAWGPVALNVAVPAFNDLSVIPPSVLAQTPDLSLNHMRAVSVDLTALKFILKDAPPETIGAPVQNSITVTLPTPDGQSQRFKVWEVSIMAPPLAAQLPDVKTYRGVGIDDPTALLAADVTAHGFHSSVRSPNGNWYVDPYFHLSQSVYSIYDSDDLNNVHGGGCGCETCAMAVAAQSIDPKATPPGGTRRPSNGSNLRTFRLAVAATGEYTTFHGGTVTLGQAAIVTAINRVNQVYESELSIRMNLVGNNSNLVYTNAGTDPYTNNVAKTLVEENQTNVDAVILTANYDIGHVFSTGAGGFAPGPVGVDGEKAKGATGRASPTGDAFWIDYVAHEIGHQFSANHTFNGVNGGDQHTPSAAYEPGSGSTIMGYAGIMGSDNIQSNSDAYFHFKSLDQISNYIIDTIPTVGTLQSTGNVIPSVSAGGNYTIPANTPFLLTGSGSDPSGTVYYTWEQYDLGPSVALGTSDNGKSPLYRSLNPSTVGNVRSIPRLATVLAGKAGTADEVAVTTSRDLNFQLTARDSQGGYNSDDTVIKTVNTGSGFKVTNFNAATSVVAGSKQTVTWNVANTNASPINTFSVFVELSTDGGNTFEIISSPSNTGSAEVTLPDNANTTSARFRISAVGNIFYDINDVNFTITPLQFIPVTNTDSNNSKGSLRYAIETANVVDGYQTITFSSLFNTPQTISLNGELPISSALAISGPGAGLLTLSGMNANRIFNTAKTPAANGISLTGMTLTAGKGVDGGAIYVEDESLSITDCVISNSTASEDGGAINVQLDGFVNLSRSTLSGNSAAGDGGGIYFNLGGGLVIIGSTIANNKASTGGGLTFWGTVGAFPFQVIDSTVAGNSATVGGGGIALKNFNGKLDVRNSTVTGNYTFSVGGGGIAHIDGSGSISLSSSVVSGNTGPSNAPDILGGTVNVQYSAVGSTTGFTLSGSNNLIGQNLKLRPLANNGGPTQTIAFDFDSPLRGAGIPNGLVADQRLFPRHDGGGVDIGAFELQTTVFNTNNSGAGSLRDAVAESNRVVGTDVINFGSLFGTVQTITLLTGEIDLIEAVTIQGNGESLTRISGNNISRIFDTTAIPAGKTVTLRGLTLTAGSAASDGGAILADDEFLVVEDSTISSSFAAKNGGAIAVGAGNAGKLSLRRSTLSGNSVGSGRGGAIQLLNAGLSSEIIDSTLVGNKATVGGAVYLTGNNCTLEFYNSTLSGNTANNGGGFAMADFLGFLTIRSSTITANTANGNGGGIHSFNGNPVLQIESTIVSGNASPTGPDISSTTTLSVNRSAIGSAAGFTLSGANNLPFGTNLKLGSLANNGGTTLTYLPSNDSPLINAGSNPANLTTDQRGVVRTLFGVTDIGSVESAIEPPDTTAPTITSITSTTGNGTYGVGTPINIAVIFSESVTLTGTVNVTLDTGAVVSITGPITANTLNGTYTVAAGQKSPDLNVTGIALTGGSTIRDAASNGAALTLPSSNLAVNKNIVISTPDLTAPTITSITSPTPNGTYGPGANIGVSLNFSESVTLSGFLFIFLDSGGSLLIQGPQNGATLSGTYSVGFNQNSPDLNVTVVQLQSGNSLIDSEGNNAVLTLPVSNLANNAAIVVSTPATPTFTVTNTNNSGAGSLRQAVLDANNTAGFQSIVFDSSFNTAKTITLTSGELSILDGVSINGPGATLVTINGNNAGRVFNIASGSSVTISGVGITGGQASSGGGIFIGANRPLLNLIDVRVFNNSATNQGGGIWIGDSTNFTITRSTLSGNTAGTNGGGFYAQASSSTIIDSAIVNNKSNFGSGGGFFSYAGLAIRNSTISGNSAAGLGGGVGTGGITILNCTITNNTSNSGGGGVARTFGNGFINIESSIVSGNTAPSPDISSGGTVNVNFSAIGSNAGFTLTGGNNVAFGTNLKLGALASNGGPTQTHALPSDSPAINKGSNSAGLSLDQRGPGFARVSGGTTDIGSYELFISPLIVLNANDSGANSLRDAIAFANSNPGADSITFDAAFFSTPRTITLGGTQMAFTDTTGATTVTGPGLGFVTVTGNNLSRVFLVNSGVTVSLAGMTIAGGNAIDGGVLFNSGTLTIDNSRFTGNKSGTGGAIRNDGTLIVSNSTFDNNTANTGNGFGGAIASFGVMNVSACTFTANQSSVLGGAIVANGDATISASTFTNNSSSVGGALRFHGTVTVSGSTLVGNSATEGGGVANYGTLNVTNTKLNSNTAVNNGGAIYNVGALGVSNSTFDNNAANSGNGWGGAIINGSTATVATVASCTFTNNYAAFLGGALMGYSYDITDSTFANNIAGLNGGAVRTDGIVTISRSTFNGNSAANDGGAIMSHGNTTITNSTLASNTAASGGGVFFFEGVGTMRNVTTAYNTATNTGGGTRVGTAASVTAVNTIVAGNTAPTGPDVFGTLSGTSSNNVLNLSATLAGLSTLAYNGGPTQTIALLPGSPAINGGTSVGSPITDQRGTARVGNTDIGAVEAQTLQPAKLVQITINGGAVQRSRVTSLAVTFDHLVSFATTPAAGFQLQRQSDGKLVNLSGSVNPAGNVVTLSFLAGDAVDFGSLADGRYTLTINAGQFASDGFDGNGNGVAGDDYTLVGTHANGLFRLFGDADGDGDVDVTDFVVFRAAFGSGPSIFDFDGDGDTDITDFVAFRLRFGTMV